MSSNIQIEIYFDKQTVTNSFLVAFFTRTCHVIFMKTIAYVTVTLNKRHELFDLLLSTATFDDSAANRKQTFWMTISSYNRYLNIIGYNVSRLSNYLLIRVNGRSNLGVQAGMMNP